MTPERVEWRKLEKKTYLEGPDHCYISICDDQRTIPGQSHIQKGIFCQLCVFKNPKQEKRHIFYMGGGKQHDSLRLPTNMSQHAVSYPFGHPTSLWVIMGNHILLCKSSCLSEFIVYKWYIFNDLLTLGRGYIRFGNQDYSKNENHVQTWILTFNHQVNRNSEDWLKFTWWLAPVNGSYPQL